MDSNYFENYTKPNPEAFKYISILKKKIGRPAYYKNSKYAGKLTERQKKAMSEKEKPVVDRDKIIKFTNEILMTGGFKPVDNPILEGDLLTEILSHSSDDEYYEETLKPYGLSSAKQLIWMRFANDGHLGVVAAGNDINFDYTSNSYKVIEPCKTRDEKLDWDKSFVLIFPLNAVSGNIKYNRDEVETAVGNYLTLEKDVPILDYYSHNYH